MSYKIQKIKENIRIIDTIQDLPDEIKLKFRNIVRIKLDLFEATWYKNKIKQNLAYHWNDDGKVGILLSRLDENIERYTEATQKIIFRVYRLMLCLSM